MASIQNNQFAAIEKFSKLAHIVTKKNIVVFAGRLGGRFIDNVKYIFSHCVQNDVPFESYFLTHFPDEHKRLTDKKLPSILFPSDEALRILTRARVVVADDFWFKTKTPAYHLLSAAKIVQIWHGIPLKLIGFPEIKSGVNMTQDKVQHLTTAYSGYEAVVTTSPFVTRTSLGDVFRTKRIWETGYPRNDVLMREANSLDLIGVDTEGLERILAMKKNGHKIVFFMPTFRDTGGDPFSEGILNPMTMDAFGREHKIVFVLKFHPYIRIEANLGLKNVFLVRSDTDPYPLLRHADCLLTDYSSIAYDFLLTGRPLVYLPYDLEKYLTKDRGMFYPFDKMSPGPKPTDQKALFDNLVDILIEHKDDYARERHQLAHRLFTFHDENSSARIAGLITQTFFAPDN